MYSKLKKEKAVGVIRLPKDKRGVLVPVAMIVKGNVLCICDRARESCGDRNRVLYRISESNRATLFLDALNFYKDEVQTRCTFLDTAGNVFAADVFYHGNCLHKYLLRWIKPLCREN